LKHHRRKRFKTQSWTAFIFGLTIIHIVHNSHLQPFRKQFVVRPEQNTDVIQFMNLPNKISGFTTDQKIHGNFKAAGSRRVRMPVSTKKYRRIFLFNVYVTTPAYS